MASEAVVTLVDSNVLLDVATDDPAWADWSADELARSIDLGTVCINAIVYAEVGTRFDRVEELNAFLPETAFRRDQLPYPAGFLAARAFLAYRRRGGSRPTPLPDFYIGAHAAVSGYRLLTRDGRRFRTYFPSIDVVAPEHDR